MRLWTLVSLLVFVSTPTGSALGPLEFRAILPNSPANRKRHDTHRQMRAGLPPSLPLEGAMIPNPLTAVTSTPEGSDGSVQDQRPTLLPPLKREVSTRAGQTASLTCRVQNLGYRQLMWIRARDLHVLSSGSEIFSTDSRVSVLERDGAWTLTIRYAQPRDGGKYACQVNTQPPIAEWFNLTVVEARAVITGKERIYVQSGSNISLTCTVREQLVVPGLVLWYHDEALVARDSSRVSVATTIDEVTTSVLTISSAAYPDSGNYSCWPSGGTPDSIQLLVIRGEPPAAMQHGNSATLQNSYSTTPLTLLVLVLLNTFWSTGRFMSYTFTKTLSNVAHPNKMGKMKLCLKKNCSSSFHKLSWLEMQSISSASPLEQNSDVSSS